MKRLLACFAVASSLWAQDHAKTPPKAKIIAIRGAKIYTLTGTNVDAGTVLVENGKIAAVGADVKIPDGAEVVDGAGKVIIPGLIDAASRLFVDLTNPNAMGSADQNVQDGLDAFQEDYREAVRCGVTTIAVAPVNRGVVNGLGAVLKLNGKRDGHNVLRKDAFLRLSLAGGGDVSTAQQRYELYHQLKQAFEAAKQYLEQWDKYRKDLADYELKKKQWDAQQKEKEKAKEPKKEEPKKEEPKKDEPKKEEPKKDEAKKDEPKKDELKEEPKKPQKPFHDPRNEILTKTFHPTNPLALHVEVHFPDSIEYALRLAEDFKITLVLEQCTDGQSVAETIAKAKTPVIVGPVFRYGLAKVDYLNHSEGTAAAFLKAGIPVAIGSFPDPNAGHTGIGATRFLMDGAALASSKGMTREQALRAITADAAKILGVLDRIGTIEKGKQADIVLLSGEPFAIETKIDRTMMDGEWVYQRKIE